MSDLDGLMAAFADGSMLRPSEDEPSIVDLSRAVMSLAGATEPAPTAASVGLASLIGETDHLVFILADGLGSRLLSDLYPDSFLAAHVVRDLTTVFPSTTAAALTSIATGEWPATHAVTGWWTHLAEIAAAAVVLRYVRRSDGRSLSGLGVTPEQAFPVPSMLDRVPRDSLLLLPEFIAGSVYTSYISGGRPSRGYRSLGEAADAVVERVQAARGPTYTYLYSHRIDSAAHARGSTHRETRAAIRELDRRVHGLADRLAGRARIVLTSDHGFLDTPDGAKHRIRPADPVMRLLRFPPSGDSRVVYLHTRRGASAQVEERLRQRFGGRFLIIATDEAEALRLLGPGPLSDTTRERVGDLIAIARGPEVVEYQPSNGPSKMIAQAAHHSGLSPAEMRVPLVVV